MSEDSARGWTEPWTKLRGGLHRHFSEGRLDEATGYLFFRLLLMVPAEGFPATGVIWTSAADIAHRICPKWSLRKAQRVLKSLEGGRYIRRWRQSGSRGTSPVQIHRWEVPFGVTQGSVIDAWGSDSYERPAFIGVTPEGNPRRQHGVSPQEVTPGGNTVLEDRDEEEEETRGTGGPSSQSLNGQKARGQVVVSVFDEVLEGAGFPVDRRSTKAADRAARSALRFLEAAGNPEPEIIRQAVTAGLADPYLKDRGFPFELWASQGARYVRQVLAGGSSRPASEDDLDRLLDAVDHESGDTAGGTK